jgi:hypothetical protein
MKINRFIALAVIALFAIAAMGLVSTHSFARTQNAPHQQVQTTSVAPAQASTLEDASNGPDLDTVEEQAGQQVEDGLPDIAEIPGTETPEDQAGVSQPDGAKAPASSSDGPVNQAASQGSSSILSVAASSNQAITTTVNTQAGLQAQDGQPEGTETPGTDTGPNEQSPKYTSSISVDQTATDGLSEADEAAALASQARISSDEAKAAALAANPGTTVVKAELDNENGALVYSVELSNGSDVKVDAGNGDILHTENGGDNEG